MCHSCNNDSVLVLTMNTLLKLFSALFITLLAIISFNDSIVLELVFLVQIYIIIQIF